MQFGKVDAAQLDNIDFNLPSEHESNTLILEGGISEKPQIFLGSAKWGRKDWKGKVYPSDAKEKDFLRHYSNQFDTIELNPTHYRIPSPEQVVKWRDTVSDDFRFCPKLYQAISHWDRLKDERGTTERFCESIRHFGDKLGPVFLQMHPSFKYNSFERLEEYLSNWPSDVKLALELRDSAWFVDEQKADRLIHLLSSRQVITVISDTAGFRDLVHMRLSTKEIMIRFVGNGVEHGDYQRIDQWIDQIEKWVNMGLEKCWFFVHQHEEVDSPELIVHMANKLNAMTPCKIKVPQLYS